ncbi:hypothetical protein GTA08_BOTSDO08401 [Neofusicoccum parvum]|nr:hypothetical protein GTA08_BOTSDO08401 [Neofusicoccum parvum]
MRIPLNPSDVSTITWDSRLVNMSSTVSNGNLEGSWEVFWTTTTRALTWADLAGCGGGGTTYRFPASPTVTFSYPNEQEAATARPFRVNPCEPLLAIPTSLTNLQPAWATCFPDAEGGDFDPPYTLTKVGGVDGPQPTKASQGASLESQVEPTTTRAPPASSSLVVDGPTPTRTVPGVAVSGGNPLSILQSQLSESSASAASAASASRSAAASGSSAAAAASSTTERSTSRSRSATSSTAAATSSVAEGSGVAVGFNGWGMSAALGGLGGLVMLFL